MIGEFAPLPWAVVLWPLVFGLGAYLLLVAQPLGRPKRDLAERLRRLDVDERLRAAAERREVAPVFASRLLEAMLRPILDDLGRLVVQGLERCGLGGREGFEGRLALVRPGVERAQFFGEKVVSGLVGLGVFPLMNALGIHPFGVWPAWACGLGFLAGFLLPDWEVERRVMVLRRQSLMELPIVLDMLTIACSAGLGLEQALVAVARESRGVVAREVQAAVREMALGQHSLGEALAALAERTLVPEVGTVAGHLAAAHEQGLPLVQALATQAEALREQKRLRILEEGGKATVRMVLPVALFILPVLFVVLVLPAALEILRLGGG